MSKIVERTLDFFEAFAAARRPLSLTELSRALDIPPSSAHDVVRALEQRGYVYETAPRAGFYPTQKLFELARVVAAHDSIAIRARPLIDDVVARTGETVTLSKAAGDSAVYLLVGEPADPVRYSVAPGSAIQSLHATSVGKSLLSTIAVDRWPGVLGPGPLKRFTAKTIVARTRLKEDVARGTARGWFVNDEESRPGVVTVSVPFRWNRALHMLTVAGPADRMHPKLAAAAAAAMAVAETLADVDWDGDAAPVAA